MSTPLPINIGSIINPDTCYVDHGLPTKPERNLLAAVLSRAICDAFGSAHCEKHITRQARHWIFARIAITKPFSFGWVAHNLDLNPEELQNSLRVVSKNPTLIAEKVAILRA